MFCQKCGKELAQDANFCPYCGEKADREMVETAHETKREAKHKGRFLWIAVLAGISFIAILIGIAARDKKPDNRQILADLNQYGYTREITYQVDGPVGVNMQTVYEAHKLTAISAKEMRQNTEKGLYEGWFQIEVEDDSLKGTVFEHVVYKYQGKNQWELTKREPFNENQERFVYSGAVSGERIAAMFTEPFYVKQVNVLEQAHDWAQVQILAVNRNGYYDCMNTKTIEKSIEFSITAKFIFDAGTMCWTCPDFGKIASGSTPVDAELINDFIFDSSQAYLEEAFDTNKMFVERRAFSHTITNDQISNQVIANQEGLQTLRCDYQSNVKMKYYTYAIDGCVLAAFNQPSGKAPAFTYLLWNEFDPETERETWDFSGVFWVEYDDSNKKGNCNMTLRHPYQGDPAKAFVRIQNIHDTGEDHVFEGVCPVSERESGGLKIEQIQVPLYMNQDYFSKEYPFMRMLNASLLIQPNKLEFSSSSMLTFLRVSGIDDDGDKIPQNGDDNASLGFHIAKEYTFEGHTNGGRQPCRMYLEYPYNGDPYTAFVRCTNERDTLLKGVQEETHKVVEEKKGVLRVYNVDIPIIEVTYSDGTYSTGAALGDIYISKEEIWLNFWGTKIVLEP